MKHLDCHRFLTFDQSDQMLYCRHCEFRGFGRETNLQADWAVLCPRCRQLVAHVEYAGGQIQVGNQGRSIDTHEIVKLVDGREAIVIGCEEGNHVFRYFVAVSQCPHDDITKLWVSPYDLTPLVNP